MKKIIVFVSFIGLIAHCDAQKSINLEGYYIHLRVFNVNYGIENMLRKASMQNQICFSDSTLLPLNEYNLIVRKNINSDTIATLNKGRGVFCIKNLNSKSTVEIVFGENKISLPLEFIPLKTYLTSMNVYLVNPNLCESDEINYIFSTFSNGHITRPRQNLLVANKKNSGSIQSINCKIVSKLKAVIEIENHDWQVSVNEGNEYIKINDPVLEQILNNLY